MAHTHEFDCRLCGEHLDSSKELDDHFRERHPGESKPSSTKQEMRSGRDSSGSEGNRQR